MIQKCLELKSDRTRLKATNFAFSIYEVLRVSLKHCKDMSPKKNYAHLPFLFTKILCLIERQRAMLGDSKFCVDKRITTKIVKRDTYWTRDITWRQGEEERRHGFPIGADSLMLPEPFPC